MMNSIMNVAAKSVIGCGMPPILFDIQNHLREVGIQINEKVGTIVFGKTFAIYLHYSI